MGKFGSVSVGRENDKRFKLSESDILEIKRLHQELKYSQNSLADMFQVSRATISYYVDPEANRKQRLKNAKRRRTPEEEHIQSTTNKQRRRDLVRPKVREYTKIQMQHIRAKDPEHAKELGRKNMVDWRKRNLDKSRQNQRNYWHRHHCRCCEHTGVEKCKSTKKLSKSARI